MSTLVLFAVIIVIFTLIKFLNITNPPRPPRIISNDSKFYKMVMKHCPHLAENYCPVRLWGANGHIQTLIHATLGRTSCPDINARRVAVKQEDGATVTWDVYEPTSHSRFNSSYTIAVCPGIANSSESAYVRALVALAREQGYRCIVLNHLGVLPHVALTSPRVFRYGSTDEYHLMLTKHLDAYPDSKLVLVGFSMGGNIVCKYLGERGSGIFPNIVGGISICQGYDAARSLKYLLGWQNLARLYLFSMTENMRSVILKNKEVLLSEDVKRRYNIEERKVVSAATLPELDDVYTRRIFGFKSVEELYRADSSSNYLEDITVPLVCINAKDDPLVHPDILTIPEKFAGNAKYKSMYIETEHGGHLGYYDGGFIIPKAITWLDRTVVSLVSALAATHESSKM